jgi:tetratricopeptide (TPR) repeat protein
VKDDNVDRLYDVGVRRARMLLGQRSADDAAAACDELAKLRPGAAEPLLLLGRARQLQGRFDDMLILTVRALELDPRHRGAQLQFAEASIFCGRHDCALQQLADLELEAANDPLLLQHIAEYYGHAGKHAQAHRCYEQAAALEPDSPRNRYNLAASLVAIGEIELAEEAFTRVIEANPDDYDAWQNRSNLRTQTPADNHIGDLEARLEKLRPGDAGEVALCYALAKEYEDLGDYDGSFTMLGRGAASRRRRMRYDVANDVEVMRRIAVSFDAAAARQPAAPARPGPIFVLGLPRSGTTLVDRILSSHSAVESMGEINDFALALTRLGRVSGKLELLEASVGIDPGALADAYLESVDNYGRTSPFFIDKTPSNYLYIGLLRRALPAAPLLHVSRHPVDSCLAMYRTLFRMGYPFTYDLEDLATYYIAYHRLMEHWRSLFPGAITEIRYEALVDGQETVSRAIVDACGLEWESACLEFDRNKAPVATASAAQVRRPIYRDALARWRRFEAHLAPLIRRLDEAGIAL